MSAQAGVFQTERLVIRKLDHQDLDMLYAVYSDADAMRWVDDGQPIAWDDCVRWVDVTLRNYETRGYGMFALALKTSGKVIGFGGIVHPRGQDEPEIKYALVRDYWGKGLATEAVCGMLTYGQQSHGLTRFIATLSPEHKASERVLQKAGMTHLKTEQDEEGEWVKTMVWVPSRR